MVNEHEHDAGLVARSSAPALTRPSRHPKPPAQAGGHRDPDATGSGAPSGPRGPLARPKVVIGAVAVVAVLLIAVAVALMNDRATSTPDASPSTLATDPGEGGASDQTGAFDFTDAEYTQLVQEFNRYTPSERRQYCEDFNTFDWLDVYDHYFEPTTNRSAAFAMSVDACL